MTLSRLQSQLHGVHELGPEPRTHPPEDRVHELVEAGHLLLCLLQGHRGEAGGAEEADQETQLLHNHDGDYDLVLHNTRTVTIVLLLLITCSCAQNTEAGW